MNRLASLFVVIASFAFAQVTVTGKDGKTVKVGTGGGVEVQNGKKTVKVGTGGNTVDVQNGDKAVKVDATGTGVDVKTGTNAVKVNTGAADDGDDGDDDAPAGKGWIVQGQGRTEAHACKAGEDVTLDGQGHTITLTGQCRHLVVNGQGSKVVTDFAESITLNGMNNTASWKAGPTKKGPKIALSGMGNAAPQLK